MSCSGTADLTKCKLHCIQVRVEAIFSQIFILERKDECLKNTMSAANDNEKWKNVSQDYVAVEDKQYKWDLFISPALHHISFLS